MGRLNHVSQTLPRNLIDRGSYANAVFILLDYNSRDGLGDYIQREHGANLDSGLLVYYRNPEPQRFRMAHAKNQAHRLGMLEDADILVNLDADNWIGEDFPAYVANKFEAALIDKEAIFLGTRANHRGPGHLVKVKTPPGCFGRIGVTKEAFRHAGGYDEVFAGWSPDDKDFAARVARLGYSWRQIRPCFLGAIKHGAGLRFGNYDEESAVFDEKLTLETRQDVRVVNQGEIGMGVVYRNFSKEPIELKRIPTRVFGIGLHKTGTTSLYHAFRLLGYDAAHWESPHWARYIWEEMRTEGRSRTLEMHYALCDLPIPLFYKELDKAYPGSKFILTIRDEDSWINSIKTHWTLRPQWDNDVFSNEAHHAVYGTTEFDEAVFRARYRKHNEDVIKYFRGRDNFLVMNIGKGTKWSEICWLLDVPVPNVPFPHMHKSSTQTKYQNGHAA